MATHMDDPALAYVRPITPDLPFKLIGGFAAACFIGALVTDIVYAQAPDMVWVTFSVWAITIGLLVALAATVVGLVDRFAHRRLGALGPLWVHLLGFALVVVVEIVNAFVHSRDAYQAVVPEGIALSFVAVLLLLLTPFFGRAYRRNQSRKTMP